MIIVVVWLEKIYFILFFMFRKEIGPLEGIFDVGYQEITRETGRGKEKLGFFIYLVI